MLNLALYIALGVATLVTIMALGWFFFEGIFSLLVDIKKKKALARKIRTTDTGDKNYYD